MYKKTIKQLSSALHNKDFSSEELVSSYLQRCESNNADLNCFISLMPETAIAQARSADKIIQKGEAGPLTGIPLAHKDIFCTNGTNLLYQRYKNFLWFKYAG